MDYDPKSSHAEESTHHGEVEEALVYGGTNSINRELTDKILAKTREHKGLTHREAMVLLNCGLENKNQEIYKLAEQIKRGFYGNHIVLFTPLCLSNYYIDRCVYCPYHVKNKHIPGKKLTQDEIRREVMTLQDMRHKRLALETGEDPVHNPIEYMLGSIDTIYGIKRKNDAMRHVNINIAAATVEGYKRLKDMGIGIYILFQEMYRKESCEKPHPTGLKHDYCYHAEVMDRAQMGGIDDVDCDVLFSLGLYRYEFIGPLMHAEHLETMFGMGPHAISVSRMRRADDIDPGSFDNGIDNDTFAKLVACIRIAVFHTGMIISTRESQKTRERMLRLGTPQISGGSKASVGGYFKPEPEDEYPTQFDVSDNRTLDQVVNWLMGAGYIPSLYTACYREGRTGDRFMSLCKSGQIQNCCHPNALTTLKKYLMDYSSGETRRIGEVLIKEEIGSIPEEKVYQIVRDNLVKVKQGVRNFRF